MSQKVKSRKLWGAIILIVIALATVFFDKTSQFMEVSPFIMQVFGLYIVGNVGTKFSGKK